MPLRIGVASTKLYIERGADWCGQGKNNSFFEGCGASTCPYGITQISLFTCIGQDTYQAPPLNLADRSKLDVAVDPASNRLQLLTPFKAWSGEDIKDCAVLIKVCRLQV